MNSNIKHLARFIAVGGLAVGLTYVGYSYPAWSRIAIKKYSPDMELTAVQSLVTKSSNGNAIVERILPQEVQGMTGAVVKASGQRFIAWIPQNRKGIFVGALFDEKGDNLTTKAMKDHNVMPEKATAAPSRNTPQQAKAGLIDAVEKADGILEGNAGPIVHAFIDLNCGYCTGLYQQLRPLIDSGKLRVHWIPVAVLHASSVNLAADVLEASNPATTLAAHEAREEPANSQSGAIGKQPNAKTQSIIEANSSLLKVVNDGVAATPVLLFRGKNGQVFQHAGMLQQATDILAAGA